MHLISRRPAKPGLPVGLITLRPGRLIKIAEIIAEFRAKHANHIQANQATIFSMLQRRPCTSEQIADIFGMHLNEVSKYLGNLMRADQICALREKATVYYAATDRNDERTIQRAGPTT